MTQSEDKPQGHDAQGPEELRAQVEQTRQELGETVEALAAKTDVKARAQQKAAAVKEQAGHVAAQARDKAGQTAAQVRDRTAHAGHVMQDKAPEPLLQKAGQGIRVARENRTALIAAAAGLLALVLMRGRRKGRR
jgi:hypothetical protein